MVYDVVIVGGGIVGLATARALAIKGYKVTVLDSLVYKQLSLTSFCHNHNFELVVGDVRITLANKAIS